MCGAVLVAVPQQSLYSLNSAASFSRLSATYPVMLAILKHSLHHSYIMSPFPEFSFAFSLKIRASSDLSSLIQGMFLWISHSHVLLPAHCPCIVMTILVGTNLCRGWSSQNLLYLIHCLYLAFFYRCKICGEKRNYRNLRLCQLAISIFTKVIPPFGMLFDRVQKLNSIAGCPWDLIGVRSYYYYFDIYCSSFFSVLFVHYYYYQL